MGGFVLITGAAAGIGKATAECLAKRNWRIAAVDINEESLKAVVSRCKTLGGDANPFTCDLTDDSSVAKMYSRVKNLMGVADVIVHSAGIGRYAPFLEIDVEEWKKMLEVNLLGIVRLTRLALADMLSLGSGRIIIIGSRRGLEPAPGTSAYSASKAALVGFSRGLAQEVADKGVHICLLAPGGVKTDFGDVPSSEKDSRYLDPNTVAESVAHIAETPPGAWIREMTLLPLGL